MNKKVQTAKYVFADYVAALIAWLAFFSYRKHMAGLDVVGNPAYVFDDPKLYYGLLIIPVFWLLLYALTGTYRRVYKKSRLRELGQTISITLIGAVILFFTLIIDDEVLTYSNYYRLIGALLTFHFVPTYLFRLILTSITAYRIKNKLIGFNTIIVGSNGNAISIFNDIENQEKSTGNRFVGFVSAVNYPDYKLEKYLTNLGQIGELKKIVEEHRVEEVIIALERSEVRTIEEIITQVQDADVVIKVIPEVQDFLFGTIKSSAIFQAPLVEITPDVMPAGQLIIKRVMDVAISFLALIVLSPVLAIAAIAIKSSSPGPVLYRQERIGKHGKPFTMIKLRSMYVDAENDGIPRLSSKEDPRITRVGRTLRRYRIDEFPQFWTVLKGDMSLVGPRPERQYFIDQIVQHAPHYMLLFRIKPGITSWGQVKYGYAENLKQMLERLKFDILYLENMSLAMDIKILIYTVLIVMQGRGK